MCGGLRRSINSEAVCMADDFGEAVVDGAAAGLVIIHVEGRKTVAAPARAQYQSCGHMCCTAHGLQHEVQHSREVSPMMRLRS